MIRVKTNPVYTGRGNYENINKCWLEERKLFLNGYRGASEVFEAIDYDTVEQAELARKLFYMALANQEASIDLTLEAVKEKQKEIEAFYDNIQSIQNCFRLYVKPPTTEDRYKIFNLIEELSLRAKKAIQSFL